MLRKTKSQDKKVNTAEQIQAIANKFQSGKSISEIAIELDCDRDYIINLIYSFVGGDELRPYIITKEMVREIVESGVDFVRSTQKLKMPSQALSNILNNIAVRSVKVSLESLLLGLEVSLDIRSIWNTSPSFIQALNIPDFDAYIDELANHLESIIEISDKLEDRYGYVDFSILNSTAKKYRNFLDDPTKIPQSTDSLKSLDSGIGTRFIRHLEDLFVQVKKSLGSLKVKVGTFASPKGYAIVGHYDIESNEIVLLELEALKEIISPDTSKYHSIEECYVFTFVHEYAHFLTYRPLMRDYESLITLFSLDGLAGEKLRHLVGHFPLFRVTYSSICCSLGFITDSWLRQVVRLTIARSKELLSKPNTSDSFVDAYYWEDDLFLNFREALKEGRVMVPRSLLSEENLIMPKIKDGLVISPRSLNRGSTSPSSRENRENGHLGRAPLYDDFSSIQNILSDRTTEYAMLEGEWNLLSTKSIIEHNDLVTLMLITAETTQGKNIVSGSFNLPFLVLALPFGDASGAKFIYCNGLEPPYYVNVAEAWLILNI